jgi:hypothetical protein
VRGGDDFAAELTSGGRTVRCDVADLRNGMYKFE